MPRVTLTLRAPAKVNPYLELHGKRADGYHEIETLMAAISWYDRLTLETDRPPGTVGGGELTLTCDTPDLPTDERNLVTQAVALLRAETGIQADVAIHLEKDIPWAAGLGGGSADAAATLWGLNKAWELGADTVQLAAWGARLGSDIPFFFHGPLGICTGRGEIVDPLPATGSRDLVVYCPPEGIPTAAAYRNVPPNADLTPAPQPRTLLVAFGHARDQTRFRFYNRLQAAALVVSKAFATAWSATEPVARLPEVEARLMTGSGSGIVFYAAAGGSARITEGLTGLPGRVQLARTLTGPRIEWLEDRPNR